MPGIAHLASLGPLHAAQLHGRAQWLRPSTTVGDWADPNSVLSSVSLSGKTVSLTLQNPAASRDLPSTGASYVIPVRCMLGHSVTVDNAAVRHLLMAFAAGTSVPADCWVGLSWINTSTVAAATIGIGNTVQGNGTGLRGVRNHYSGGWAVAGATTYTATVRYGMHAMAPVSSGTTQSKQVASCCYDTDGALLSAATGSDGTNTYTTAPVGYVAISCGWIAGTGAGGSVIQFTPYCIAAAPNDVPGAAGSL